MDFIELKIAADTQETRDILTGRLLELGFESFVEEEGTLLAYISSGLLDTGNLESLLGEFRLQHTLTTVPKQNWNEEWEKNYDPVLVSGKCLIRAPFHAAGSGFPYEIVIEPKMSFGTAHHETTSLMIELMLETDFTGKKVLDMGCGTGILAILARKLGAGEVVAADIDDWSVENTLENIARNSEPSIRVIHGDVKSVTGTGFDVILANINRNILLEDMAGYTARMNHGDLFLSGFYTEDIPAITSCTEKQGFMIGSSKSKNNWVAIKLSR